VYNALGDSRIEVALRSGGGVASRADLLLVAPRAVIDNEVRRGRLQAAFPRSYLRPWDADDRDLLRRAALVSVGGQNALSHTTALVMLSVIDDDGGPLHVTAFNPRHPRGVAGRLTVHRTVLPLRAVWRNGLPVVGPAVSLVAAWPMLDDDAATAALLRGCRSGCISEGDLNDALRRARPARGVARLRHLAGLVSAGCESELEMWGYLHVFDVPGLRHAVRQRDIEVDGRRYRADMAYEQERVVVELDGRAYHASPQQWDRDIARDLALARAGWQTVRLSHRRLTTDIEGCRRDLLEVLAVRRAVGHAAVRHAGAATATGPMPS
jgi:very-short-patch-repair endonuclease